MHHQVVKRIKSFHKMLIDSNSKPKTYSEYAGCYAAYGYFTFGIPVERSIEIITAGGINWLPIGYLQWKNNYEKSNNR